MTPDNMNTQQWKERAQKAEQELRKRSQEAEQELEKRSQEAEQKAEKRIQEVEKRAERRVQKAEQKAEKRVERRIQKAEEKTRGLSWPEALSLWHKIHANPTIKFHYKPIGAGHFTKAAGRRYPTRLCHWRKFHRLHEKAFRDISHHFAKPESSAFYSRELYEAIAKYFMSDCILDRKAALVAYEKQTIEYLVVDTWRRMGEGKIRFKDREDRSKLENPQYAKVCYVTTDQGESIDLFVVEYEAADKLTADLVKAGLHKMKVKTSKERMKVSAEAGARKVEIAEEAIVVVLTQTFDYMVSQGLSYGYVNGGGAFIFLYIDPQNLQSHYYESVVLEEASATPSIDPDQLLRLTARCWVYQDGL